MYYNNKINCTLKHYTKLNITFTKDKITTDINNRYPKSLKISCIHRLQLVHNKFMSKKTRNKK